MMAGALADNLPTCARAVFVPGVTSFAHGLLELLSAAANGGGEVVVLLAREQAAMREELAAAFDARGVLFEVAPLGEDAAASKPAAQPAFIEVAGPHARAYAYANAIDKLVKARERDTTSRTWPVPERTAERRSNGVPSITIVRKASRVPEASSRLMT